MPFDEIRNDVTSGRPTLFTGLPCQCAAIKAAFGKYSNLMVVSLICNSVPSAEEWKRYVEHIENEKHSKVVSVDMRYNVNDMLIKFENGEIII